MNATEITLKTDIQDLQPLFRPKAIGTRIVHALHGHSFGYCTVADLVASSRSEIAQCNSLGPKCLDEIERVLRENGFALETDVNDKEWAFVKKFAAGLVGKCIRHKWCCGYNFMRVRDVKYSLAKKRLVLYGEGFKMQITSDGYLYSVSDLWGSLYTYYKKVKDIPRRFREIPEAEFIAKHIVWKRMVEIANQELKK